MSLFKSDKSKNPKLSLKRESFRVLTDEEAGKVVGGELTTGGGGGGGGGSTCSGKGSEDTGAMGCPG